MAKTKNTQGKTSELSKSLEDFPPKVAVALAALAPLSQRFVILYCGTARHNGRLASDLVGIRGGVFTQANWASKQLRRADVRVAVDAWMQAFSMSVSEIITRQEDLARVSPIPFLEVTQKGKLRLKEKIDPKEWEKHAHWVKAVRMDADGSVIDLELHDPQDALKELAKINKMYSDAPIFSFHLQLSQLSDAELLRQLEAAREENIQPRLPSSTPVIEFPPPEESLDGMDRS